MEIIVPLAIILILCVCLVKSADLMENAFVVIAQKLGINTFVIGFVVLAIATSTPEISIMVTSAVEGVPSLSLGNLLGATLVLITLAIALNTYEHKTLPFHGSYGVHQLFITLGVLATLIIFILDQSLSSLDGVILLGVYIVFVAYIAYHTRGKHLKEPAKVKSTKLVGVGLKAAAGLLGLIIFSRMLVDYSISLANLLNVPKSVIGILVLAVGTNLPELTILFRSQGKDKENLAIGNFIGSACVNVGTLGLLGILSPHEISNFSSYIPIIVLLSLAILLVGAMAWTKNEISRREAGVLLLIYFTSLAAELIMVVTAPHA